MVNEPDEMLEQPCELDCHASVLCIEAEWKLIYQKWILLVSWVEVDDFVKQINPKGMFERESKFEAKLNLFYEHKCRDNVSYWNWFALEKS